jgi:hypothetical protein
MCRCFTVGTREDDAQRIQVPSIPSSDTSSAQIETSRHL